MHEIGLKHWRYVVRDDNYIEIFCPTMHNGIDDFATKKEVYKEFKELDAMIMSKRDCKGWLGNTKLIYPHVIRMFVKVGAQPYFIDIKTDQIFFVKETE